MAELNAFDKSQKIEFRGYCKLSINRLSSLLIVEPVNEDFKMISASFNLKYVAQKNMLFVFAEHDFMDFALIFQNEKICKKVVSYIFKDQQNSEENSPKENRLIPHIFNKILDGPKSCKKLTKIVAHWLKNLDEENRNHYIQMTNECSISDIILKEMENINVDGDMKGNSIKIQRRKRKHGKGQYAGGIN